MSLGINYDMANAEFLAMQRAKLAKYGELPGTDSSIFAQTQVPQSENYCTDGVDDGKIGIGEGLKSLGKGVWNGLVGGIKGMFTDSEGKFSLGKTLTSVGIGALCIAFPAVGAVACGIGAVTGGVQLAKGVAGAVTADTDAEMKDALEGIGEGGATAISCAMGAKASIGAMKSASSAARFATMDETLGLVDDLTKPLAQVDDMATILKNRGFDNADEILKSVQNLDDIDEVYKAVQQSGKYSALDNIEDGATGMAKVTNWLKAFASDAKTSTIHNFGTFKTAMANGWQGIKGFFKNHKLSNPFKDADGKFSLKGLFKGKKAKGANTTAKANPFKQARATIKGFASKSEVYNHVTSGGFKNVLKNIKNWDALKTSLGTDKAKILTLLQSNPTQAISQYGWSEVGQVIEAIYGFGQVADNW